jgi:hypothetical protein
LKRRKLYFHRDGHAAHHCDRLNRFLFSKCVDAGNIGCGYFKSLIQMPDWPSELKSSFLDGGEGLDSLLRRSGPWSNAWS